jgi:hypothetical protein
MIIAMKLGYGMYIGDGSAGARYAPLELHMWLRVVTVRMSRSTTSKSNEPRNRLNKRFDCSQDLTNISLGPVDLRMQFRIKTAGIGIIMVKALVRDTAKPLTAIEALASCYCASVVINVDRGFLDESFQLAKMAKTLLANDILVTQGCTDGRQRADVSSTDMS